MADDTKKPTQNDSEVLWLPPKDNPDWKKIELYGKPPKRPNVRGWYELDPETNGMTITYGESTEILKVMCGGITYEVNFNDLYPPVPVAGKPPPDPCDPRSDTESTYVAEVKDVKYAAYFRQTKCLLQINCTVDYTLVKKTVRCDKSLKKWKPKGQAKEDIQLRTRASFFTCPCRD